MNDAKISSRTTVTQAFLPVHGQTGMSALPVARSVIPVKTGIQKSPPAQSVGAGLKPARAPKLELY